MNFKGTVIGIDKRCENLNPGYLIKKIFTLFSRMEIVESFLTLYLAEESLSGKVFVFLLLLISSVFQ